MLCVSLCVCVDLRSSFHVQVPVSGVLFSVGVCVCLTFGVLLLSCVCVGAGGVVFCRCMCVCDLISSFHVQVPVSGVLFSVGVCVYVTFGVLSLSCVVSVPGVLLSVGVCVCVT